MTCRVVIVGLPPAAGCPDGKTWRSAAGFVRSRLAGRFGSAVSFEYLDLFSPEMASHPEIEALIQTGALAPIVLVDEEVQSFGGKLHVSAIERAVAQRLAVASGSLPTEEFVS